MVLTSHGDIAYAFDVLKSWSTRTNVSHSHLLRTNDASSVSLNGKNIGTVYFSEEDIYGAFRRRPEGKSFT